jgi:hypothetical protein
VWVDPNGIPPTSNARLVAQRLNNAGGNVWTPQVTVADTKFCSWSATDTTNNCALNMTTDGMGGAFVAYGIRDTNSSPQLLTRHLSGSGAISAETRIGGGSPTAVQLIDDGGGGAIIAWQDALGVNSNGFGTESDIRAQRVSNSGVVQWGNGTSVLISGAPHAQFAPQLTGDEMGGAIIVWTDTRSGSNQDVYAQGITASGQQ